MFPWPACSLDRPTYLPRVEPSETRYEFADDVTWIKGNHTIKFGFNCCTTEDYNYFISNAFGSYTYLTPTAFAQDYSRQHHGREELDRLLADLRQSRRRLHDQRICLVCAGSVEGHAQAHGELGSPLG